MAKNNTTPLNLVKKPHPARHYTTIGVNEEALQTFNALSFVMPQANGRYIEYDGTTDPATVDVRFATEQPHNYAAFVEGRNKLEVLEKAGEIDIEITAYKGGAALTEADLAGGKVYGVSKIAIGAGNNKTGETVWVLDVTKTASTVAFCRIKENSLRGFLANGVVKDFNTGGVEDLTARVLISLIK